MARLAAVLALCLALVATSMAATSVCFDHLSVVRGVADGEFGCLCDVGYTNEEGYCVLADGEQDCSESPAIEAMTITNSVSVVEMSIADNYLLFEAAVSFANQRRLEALYLNMPSCGYPFDASITHETCSDVIELSKNLDDLILDCEFYLENVEDYQVAYGTAYATVSERLESIRGFSVERQIFTKFDIEVQVRSTFSVESGQLHILSPVSIEGALVRAEKQEGYFYVGIAIVMPGGYVLNPTEMISPELSNGAQLNDGIFVTQDEGPQCETGSECMTMWTMSVSTTDGLCNLDGAYNIQFTVECESGPCGLPAASIAFNLALGDICPSVQVDNQISASMAAVPFDDIDVENVFTDIDSGRSVAIIIEVHSDMSIVDIDVSSLLLVYNNTYNDRLLIDSGEILSSIIVGQPTYSEGLVIIPFAASRSSDPLSDADFILPDEMPFAFNLEAEIRITYSGQFSGVYRRSISGGSMTLKQAFELKNGKVSVQSAASQNVAAVAAVTAAAATAGVASFF